MAIQPPEIEAFPPAPQRKNKDTFANLFDDVITWFSRSVGKLGQACVGAYQNALEAAASAEAATASADAAINAAGAVQWVSGTTYAKGKTVWSPLDLRTYRRKVAGSGTTDPSADFSNWVALNGAVNMYELLATATVSTAVANIDFLSIFNSSYDKYVVEIQGACLSTDGASLSLLLARAGAVDTTQSYYEGQTSTAAGSLSLGGNLFSLAYASLTVEIRDVNNSASLGVKSISIRGAMRNASQVNAIRQAECGFRGAALSGFRIYASSGNISAGMVRVYGLRNN